MGFRKVGKHHPAGKPESHPASKPESWLFVDYCGHHFSFGPKSSVFSFRSALVSKGRYRPGKGPVYGPELEQGLLSQRVGVEQETTEEKDELTFIQYFPCGRQHSQN